METYYSNVARRWMLTLLKETFTKDEVIEMLRQMQQETAECCGFIVGTVTQAWVIKDMLGKRIEELGGGETKLSFK